MPLFHPQWSEASHFERFLFSWRHPWFRMFICTFIAVCNFLIYAEDPIAHSKADAVLPVFGSAGSFVFRMYPDPSQWPELFILKVFLVPLSIATGLVVGRQIVHRLILKKWLKLKAFQKSKGSWFVMFFVTIVCVFIYSQIYNAIILAIDPDTPWVITDYVGLTNENFMRLTAAGTWLGDSVTAMMVLDMMLQDSRVLKKDYPDWVPWLVTRWKGRTRIIVFWVLMLTLTILVMSVIGTDNVSWDNYNGALFNTNELARASLAAIITMFDLLIVIQDWEFPTFESPQEVNIVGLGVSELRWSFLSNLLKSDFWEIHVTGKWFNYGIIFVVMCLDMNMLKNQVLYNTDNYAQYPEPPHNRIWTVGTEDEANDPLVLSNLTFASRGNSTCCDFRMNARYDGVTAASESGAASPAIIGAFIFFLLYWRIGKYMQEREDIEIELEKRAKGNGRRRTTTQARESDSEISSDPSHDV